MHASDAAALFAARDEDEAIEDGDADGGGGDELDIDELDSRGGSPVGKDEDTIAVRFLLL